MTYLGPITIVRNHAGESSNGAATEPQQQQTQEGLLQQQATSGLIGPSPPLCSGHQEPCQKKRVSKSGPNKGEGKRLCLGFSISGWG